VKIHDAALVTAVKLSERYITSKFLPDKAIDLVDEAAAKVKTAMYSLPSELDKINRMIIDKETERISLSTDADDLAKKRLQDIEAELELLKVKQKKEHDN
jgi:ATP-dependent Clp protease ATP-binding subunit ClpB